jgi:KUP system potassium uptake protein
MFKSSANLSAAYGLAVNGTMLITSLLAAGVFHYSFGWSKAKSCAFFIVFAAFDLVFLAANSMKFLEGGWLPLAMGSGLFFLMITWKSGRQMLKARMLKNSISLDDLIETLKIDMPHRPKGLAIFLHSGDDGVPPALLHNMRHNQVLHREVVVLTIHTAEKPHVSDDDRLRVRSLGEGIWRAHLTFGFRETPDLPRALKKCAPRRGLPFDHDAVSYFLNRESLSPARDSAMSLWREKVFIAMSKNANTASSHFHIPANQVVELGACVEI